MNIKTAFDEAIKLGHIIGEVFPPVEGGVAIAESFAGFLDQLRPHAPDAQSGADLEKAHGALLKRMTDKGHALSDRLRGE